MAHLTTRGAYEGLVDRLNRGPQGAPSSDVLFAILKLLFSEKEAELISVLPLTPFRPTKAAKLWRTSVQEANKVLDDLASRGMMLDLETAGGSLYFLPPPMAGFFEFSLMRLKPGDADQKKLAELFHQYLNVEEDFIKELFTVGETRLGRVFINENTVAPEMSLEVLDHERMSHIIDTASHIGVGACYCRHKMMHVGEACDAPLEDVCLTFNSTASSLIKHGHIKPISRERCRDVVDEARDAGLVQFGDNVQRSVNFVCNCCGCCCEALLAARRFAFLNPVTTSNFICSVDTTDCNGCGKCVAACPVEALTLVSANDPRKPKRKRAKLDERTCLGCGVCVKPCKEEAITMEARGERVITPVDSVHRMVLMSLERGKLQNVIIENQAYKSHRAMAAVIGAILRLPPAKRLLAKAQLNSRFLDLALNLTQPVILAKEGAESD